MRTAVIFLAIFGCGTQKKAPEPPTADLDEPGWMVPTTQAPSTRDDSAPVRPHGSDERRLQPRPRRSRSDVLVDLDFLDKLLEEVFRTLATLGGTNIVVASGVRGAVTVRLKRAPWSEALDSICRSHQPVATRDGNVILIEPQPRL